MVNLPNDPRNERNPGARHATDLLNRETSADPLQDQRDAFEREHGGDNYKKDSETSGSELLAQREASPMNYTGGGGMKGSSKKKSIGTVLGGLLNRRRTAALGILSLLGLGGLAIGGLLAPAGMIVSLMSNFTSINDSKSASHERRFLRIFGYGTTPTGQGSDPVCVNATKNIKCKMGRISNKALNQLEKKGIVAVFDDTSVERKKTGYPDKNPSSYEIDVDGKGTKVPVPAADLASFFGDKKNAKIASRVLGVGGAFALQRKAWVGKYVTSKLYKPFGLDRKGGIADGENGKKSASDRYKDGSEKLKSKLPGMNAVSEALGVIKKSVTDRIGYAKKGGAAYVTAVASCVAVKAPSYIAAGAAAVQLKQLMPVSMETVLSPASKQQAAAFGSNFSAEDMDTAGTLLTHQVDGKSALDSQYLQAAIGVNKNKPAVSEEYTPGYAMINNPILQASIEVDRATEPACSAILSPPAMYAAMAADLLVTAASATTGVGAVVKIIVTLGVGAAATHLATQVVGAAADAALTELATNDLIPQAEGEARGDVLGLSAMSFFSAGGMAAHLPTVTESQLTAYTDVMRESEERHRDMDIASLSPFDTSSKYTFMGSMVNTARLNMFASGGYQNPLTAVASLARLPFKSLTPDASAAPFGENYCRYAAEFKLDTGDPATTPAINAAGLPCTMLTSNMGTEEAIDLLATEGWLDVESTAIADTDTITELQSKKIIKEGTPMDDFINSCSDASTGEYLLDASGCTIGTAGPGAITQQATGGDGKDICDSEGNCLSQGVALGEGEEPTEDMVPVKNSRSLEAISVFLTDFQISQGYNGEDEESAAVSNSVATGKYTLPVAVGYGMSDGFGPRSCGGCSPYHVGLDLLNSANTAVYAFGDGVVESADINGGNNIVRIKHADGLVSVYFHMWSHEILVKTGDTVTAGQEIGKIGNSGDSYGAHLHFELDISGVADPAIYEGFPKNTAGFAPPGHRIDPLPFIKAQGLPGPGEAASSSSGKDSLPPGMTAV